MSSSYKKLILLVATMTIMTATTSCKLSDSKTNTEQEFSSNNEVVDFVENTDSDDKIHQVELEQNTKVDEDSNINTEINIEESNTNNNETIENNTDEIKSDLPVTFTPEKIEDTEKNYISTEIDYFIDSDSKYYKSVSTLDILYNSQIINNEDTLGIIVNNKKLDQYLEFIEENSQNSVCETVEFENFVLINFKESIESDILSNLEIVKERLIELYSNYNNIEIIDTEKLTQVNIVIDSSIDEENLKDIEYLIYYNLKLQEWLNSGQKDIQVYEINNETMTRGLVKFKLADKEKQYIEWSGVTKISEYSNPIKFIENLGIKKSESGYIISAPLSDETGQSLISYYIGLRDDLLMGLGSLNFSYTNLSIKLTNTEMSLILENLNSRILGVKESNNVEYTIDGSTITFVGEDTIETRDAVFQIINLQTLIDLIAEKTVEYSIEISTDKVNYILAG